MTAFRTCTFWPKTPPISESQSRSVRPSRNGCCFQMSARCPGGGVNPEMSSPAPSNRGAWFINQSAPGPQASALTAVSLQRSRCSVPRPSGVRVFHRVSVGPTMIGIFDPRTVDAMLSHCGISMRCEDTTTPYGRCPTGGARGNRTASAHEPQKAAGSTARRSRCCCCLLYTSDAADE